MHKIDELNPKLRERLKFIEFRIYWEGTINRNALVDLFEISKPQASIDINMYQKLAPGNLSYDLSNKCYVASHKFKPKIYKPNAQRYLSYLDAVHCGYAQGNNIPIGKKPIFDVLPKFYQEVDTKKLRIIIAAIQNKTKVEIVYQALKSTKETLRVILPLYLVHTQHKWHLRAYCTLRNAFRNFVLGRIINIVNVGKWDDNIDNHIPDDKNWNEYVRIIVVPKPKLSKSASKITTHEYGMQDGKASVEMRRALLDYFLLDYSFTHEFMGRGDKIKRENENVAIENFDTIISELKYLDENE